MRKTRVLLLIALGLSLLISAFTNGISNAAQNTYAMAHPVTYTASLNLVNTASCMLCHSTSDYARDRDFFVKNFLPGNDNLHEQLLDKAAIAHHDSSEPQISPDPETIFALLTAPLAEQSIRMPDYTGPIIQCGFCHAQTPVKASMPIGETE